MLCYTCVLYVFVYFMLWYCRCCCFVCLYCVFVLFVSVVSVMLSLCYYFDIVNMLFSFLLCYYDLEYVLLVCVRFFLFLFGLGYVSSMFLNF